MAFASDAASPPESDLSQPGRWSQKTRFVYVLDSLRI